MPAATAAAAPPLEPPGVWSRFHGLRHAPNSSGSVYGIWPISDVLVLPNTFRPAARLRAITGESSAGTK